VVGLAWFKGFQGAFRNSHFRVTTSAYTLPSRDPTDYDQLPEAVRPQPSPLDLDVVVGMRGQIAPPEMCNGLMVPVVAVDQICSFDPNAFIKAIPRPEKTTAKEIGPVAEECSIGSWLPLIMQAPQMSIER
jgi:hypothetical protein